MNYFVLKLIYKIAVIKHGTKLKYARSYMPALYTLLHGGWYGAYYMEPLHKNNIPSKYNYRAWYKHCALMLGLLTLELEKTK